MMILGMDSIHVNLLTIDFSITYIPCIHHFHHDLGDLELKVGLIAQHMFISTAERTTSMHVETEHFYIVIESTDKTYRGW